MVHVVLKVKRVNQVYQLLVKRVIKVNLARLELDMLLILHTNKDIILIIEVNKDLKEIKETE
jgi:hypothetical protein